MSSLLFDTSPEEPERKKTTRRKTEAPVVERASEPYSPRLVSIKALATVDEGYPCLDETCRAECHDVIDECDGQWYLECFVCGTRQWIPQLRNLAAEESPEEERFVFSGGPFDGMEVDEVATMPRGIEYIEKCAETHKKAATKKACKSWLDANRKDA